MFSELLNQMDRCADLAFARSSPACSMAPEPPRMCTVSIIIPNFNNGRANARDGARDFLSELLASLELTLATESVPFEILLADDGSTDDSLETARAWAAKRWGDGRPFLRLIELSHCGVLSTVLNRLLDESTGAYIARLDGDIVLKTANWLTKLVEAFERDSQVGVVTGLQLLSNGEVHAFGDDLFGPRGYRHIGRGVPREALPPMMEVDHAMGCFYCTRREVETTVGRYDESFLRGQTEEYGVRVRKAGWRVIATKAIVFEHWHMERQRRANAADASLALDDMLELFCARHGFDRLAPDLAEVRESARGTPMLWRDLADGSVEAKACDAMQLAGDPRMQARLAEEIAAAMSLRAAQGGSDPCIVGCGVGLLPRALASHGVRCVAIECEGEACALARSFLGAASSFLHAVEDFACLPFADASQRCVLVTGVLERYWNPVGFLRELQRILAPDGLLTIRSEVRREDLFEGERSADGRHCFTVTELRDLLQHVGRFSLVGEARYFELSGTLEVGLRHGASMEGRGYFSLGRAQVAESLR